MLEFLDGLFTLSGAAVALVVLIVAVVIWRYRKLDWEEFQWDITLSFC